MNPKNAQNGFFFNDFDEIDFLIHFHCFHLMCSTFGQYINIFGDICKFS